VTMTTSERHLSVTAAVAAPRGPRRRPSGEPPALQREDRWTRWIFVLAGVLLVGFGLSVLARYTDIVDDVGGTGISWFEDLRSPAPIGGWVALRVLKRRQLL
jgi:hypothetical protein